ncbi:hypothetical protein CXB51_021353 [Gossypium anomalum]|uniref:Leucine-rich repeat family protein n=1 Tax=Gossypium anomalum TaxID=47600 RepID=A0A8J5ZAZ7_9ROSI|nr:hypothetical protein CXB51_021353 [Gossypium anomalum]
MARLTKEHVLKDEKTHDPSTITSLSLSHKALSDVHLRRRSSFSHRLPVSCLAEFENLERLDLAFNNLTSLQGLKSCVNLKWLSVVQNKLQTLEGIEGLTKLTVLNAGKNKLRSTEEVKPLVNLRALILNDNEIVSIRGLDDMKDLNTLGMNSRVLGWEVLPDWYEFGILNHYVSKVNLVCIVCLKSKFEIKVAKNTVLFIWEWSVGMGSTSRLSEFEVVKNIGSGVLEWEVLPDWYEFVIINDRVSNVNLVCILCLKSKLESGSVYSGVECWDGKYFPMNISKHAYILSRNPITEIGNSLVKLKSITKFSASNCQIQAIESSLKCCVELKELRLAHNDIKSLPSELSCNKKLQNLDLGNNLISQWSELKALDSLVHLKNLNLQGNPIAEKDKLAKKSLDMISGTTMLQVKRLLPNLHIFNARPIDKSIKNKEGEIVNIASHSTDIHMEEKTGQKRKKNSEFLVSVEKQDINHDSNATAFDTEKESKRKKKKGNDKLTEVPVAEDDVVVEKEEKKKKLKVEQKGRKTNDKSSTSKHEDGTTGEEKPKKEKKLEKRAEQDIIDDAGASFTELFSTDVVDPIHDGKRKIVDRANQDTKSSDSLVTYPVKKKKSKHAVLAELELTPAIEVGMGGASTWGDE